MKRLDAFDALDAIVDDILSDIEVNYAQDAISGDYEWKDKEGDRIISRYEIYFSGYRAESIDMVAWVEDNYEGVAVVGNYDRAEDHALERINDELEYLEGQEPHFDEDEYMERQREKRAEMGLR